MNPSTSYPRILTDESLMETALHGTAAYPFRFYLEDLSLFDFHCVEWHWHTELEFIYIESGTVACQIGEASFDLSQGSGLFINSRILHRLSSQGKALIPNFVFMPSFLAAPDSLIYQRYVLPVLSSSLEYQSFHREIPWQAEILSLIKQIQSAQESPSCELAVSALLQMLWLRLWEHADLSPADRPAGRSASSQARLQCMMQYIHSEYAGNLSLEDIARHGAVSKSTALGLFKRYLHTTPVSYLIRYRLQEAARLLLKTEKKVQAISCETGFQNLDYFCRLFKRCYHMTPTEYRRTKQAAP